ncbi:MULTISPECIES: GNAT family N-acetyltransferase [unclassified Spirosoma]|uniref:GNAT family N-acetyltransferase n=1 Tax=unclassified Spirosoma TaxID=2621999 RepID=UPI00095BE788|nr:MULTISPECIES: GNAT family N-acetyltransferase [unclassified Spirosoma]MBN8824272.1 GNAT family N-acetyltransferase [Spirosoma sp.]OJW79002.1 MAG: GNAT family N-acetyltransferase [Spirosoma sp. 48-14]
MQITVARTPEQYLAAIELFKEYALGLGIDLQFQNFDKELQILPSMYGPPKGELWLLGDANRWVGCAALRQLDEKTCELKRMYIQPGYRGQGWADSLMDTALATAQNLGYEWMKLDSLRRLTPALKLYVRYGFTEIAPYNYNPEADVVYFEKHL